MFCFWIFSLSRILMATRSPDSEFTAYFTLRTDKAGNSVCDSGVSWCVIAEHRQQTERVQQTAMIARSGRRKTDALAESENLLAEGALTQGAPNFVLADLLDHLHD